MKLRGLDWLLNPRSPLASTLVNLVKPFYLVILYLMLLISLCKSWRTLNLSPGHWVANFLSIAMRTTRKQMKRTTTIKEVQERRGRQPESRYLCLRRHLSQCQALWSWVVADQRGRKASPSSLSSLHLWVWRSSKTATCSVDNWQLMWLDKKIAISTLVVHIDWWWNKEGGLAIIRCPFDSCHSSKAPPFILIWNPPAWVRFYFVYHHYSHFGLSIKFSGVN